MVAEALGVEVDVTAGAVEVVFVPRHIQRLDAVLFHEKNKRGTQFSTEFGNHHHRLPPSHTAPQQ